MPPEQTPPGIQWRTVTWYSQTLAITLFVAVLALGFYLGKSFSSIPVEPPVVQEAVATTSPLTNGDAALTQRINTNGWLTYTNAQYGFAIKYPPNRKPDTSGLYGIAGFIPAGPAGNEPERCQFATTTSSVNDTVDSINLSAHNPLNPIYAGVSGVTQSQTYEFSSIRNVYTANDLEGVLVYVPGNFGDTSHFYFPTTAGVIDFTGSIADGQLLSSCDTMLSTLVRI